MQQPFVTRMSPFLYGPLVTFRRWPIVVAGLLSALAAVLFVLAPVEHDTTSYDWAPGRDARSTVLPLFPYEPDRLDVSFGCTDVAALGNGTLLSTTTPQRHDVEWESPAGLAITVTGGAVIASLGDRPFATQPTDAAPRPASSTCTWTARSGPGGTSLLLDGVEVGYTPERPAVNGLYTDLRGHTGLHATVVPDTRYETSPSPLKVAFGVLAVLSLVVTLWLVNRREAGRVRHARQLPEGWWRPRAPDVAVAAVLGVWTVVGPPTVDDGYIVSMLKAAGDTGFVGNYFRWFNAPEAPFSWFYELYRPFTEVSGAAWWLRLPSVALGLVLWLLIDRLLLPRLATGPGRLARWAAATVFALWYLTFGVGLRPEPWVMLGSLVVFALVERAVATRALVPLALAVVAAGATVAVTPTGVAALGPFVAAPVAVARLVRRHWPVALPTLLASAAVALLLMFADQSLPAVLHSTEVRTAIGPNFGVLDEWRRYVDVFDQDEGGLNRRMPLLLTWLAMALLACLLATRRARGLAPAPTRRLVIVAALFFVALAFTPTKYTHHFGAVGGVSTVLVGVLVHTITRGALQRAWERSLTLAAITVTVAVALAAPLRWWYLGGLGVKWSTVPPGARGIDLAYVVLAGGLVLALAILVGAERGRLPPLGVFVALAAAGAVTLEVGTMAYAVVSRTGTYTMAAANVAAPGGPSCGVENWVDVETDIAAGLLPPAPGAAPAARGGFTSNGGFPQDTPPVAPYGSARAPVWGSGGAAGSFATSWYDLPRDAGAADAPPVVVPVGGSGAVRATVQFAGADGTVTREVPITTDPDGGWRDARLDPGTATRLRIVAIDERNGDGWIAVGAPRLPKVVPLLELAPPSERVAVDWVDAFFLPCRTPPSPAGGVIQPVRYRLASGPGIRKIASVSYATEAGGPYPPLLQAANQTPLPTYLRGNKTFEPISVFRLDYQAPLLDVTTAHR